MKAVQSKIYIVILLLFASIGVSAIIYVNGGFSISHKGELRAICGTKSQNPIEHNQGRNLFYANCASCHAIHKDMTGPALAGFDKRLSIDLLYLFIQQPQKAYIKSKYLRTLKEQYNIVHFAFPSLQKEDINNIRAYINEASSPMQSEVSKLQ